MIYEPSFVAIAVFGFFVAVVLGISFYLGSKAKSASGYYAAHGEIPWFVNGIAFAGDYLSAASFLGICGMIAFYGYDGFLYSIGYLAGWIVALFVIAEPLKALGKFTFADALDRKFNSQGIKLAAAISTLVVSVFYLIPQMVGAGALVKPLLGVDHHWGVIAVGAVVVIIVATAGMVSTTWVQFIKGALLVVFCTVITAMILARGLSTEIPPQIAAHPDARQATMSLQDLQEGHAGAVQPRSGEWAGEKGADYFRVQENDGRVRVWRRYGDQVKQVQAKEKRDGKVLVNGLPQGKGSGETDLVPVGRVLALPDGQEKTGALNPWSYLATLQQSEIETWRSVKLKDEGGVETTVFYPVAMKGEELLLPGAGPDFKGLSKPLGGESDPAAQRKSLFVRLDFLSLMLALFAGTASLPHILIRYYTVKDQASARKSTVVGIASIGFFYILTLYLGLGAMTSGRLDVTNSNMAAPMLARAFGELPFAIISAISFTTVLGTVSGLIMAASGAVAHDLLGNFLGLKLTDHEKVRAGKLAAVVVGGIAMALGIVFQNLNAGFLVGWAFNVAASANLPSLIMLLFWPRTTKQGITASILVGMTSSLAWILLSGKVFRDVYGLSEDLSPMPFSQPALVTVPLSFLTLIVVSLLTPKREQQSHGA